MYVNDNQDRLPYSQDTAAKRTLFSSGRAGAIADNVTPGVWCPGIMDMNPGNVVNWDTKTLELGSIWPYTKAVAIYKCPSDKAEINVSGDSRPRTRSMAMNMWLGGVPGIPPSKDASLSGMYSVSLDNFCLYSKLNDVMAHGGVANIYVFTDMRPDAVNTGAMGVCMDGYPYSGNDPKPSMYRFWDLPSNMHAGSCSFSFADGHSAPVKWRDSRTTPPLMNPNDYLKAVQNNGAKWGANNPDMAVLQDMANRPLN
jgi:prepilin-type processing-associated H-X9-DG protein